MATSFTVGGFSHNVMDIDADGLYLYLAVLNSSSQPEILKQPADLSDVAASLYSPAAGDKVNVVAGDYSPYWIWGVGDFGGTNRVVLTEDAAYWYVQNRAPFDYWYGSAGPLHLSPHDDGIISVPTNDDLTLHHTYFVGDSLYWFDTETLPFSVGALDAMDIDEASYLIGSNETAYWYDAYWYPVNYSPNYGISWGDVSTGLPASAIITSMVLN